MVDQIFYLRQFKFITSSTPRVKKTVGPAKSLDTCVCCPL